MRDDKTRLRTTKKVKELASLPKLSLRIDTIALSVRCRNVGCTPFTYVGTSVAGPSAVQAHQSLYPVTPSTLYVFGRRTAHIIWFAYR